MSFGKTSGISSSQSVDPSLKQPGWTLAVTSSSQWQNEHPRPTSSLQRQSSSVEGVVWLSYFEFICLLASRIFPEVMIWLKSWSSHLNPWIWRALFGKYKTLCKDNKKNETAADMLSSRITLCKQVADCVKRICSLNGYVKQWHCKLEQVSYARSADRSSNFLWTIVWIVVNFNDQELFVGCEDRQKKC